MNYGYYNYYMDPLMNYTNFFAVTAVAVILAVILGIVLFCTFLRKKNEGKFSGFKGKLYNALNFNRFYAENIIKFLYIIAACVVTVVGIVCIVMGSFLVGVCAIVIGNVVLRISMELLLMFIILCKKTVSIDRRLSGIEAFYGDDFGSEAEESDESDEEEYSCGECCEECCEGCGQTEECCPTETEEETEIK